MINAKVGKRVGIYNNCLENRLLENVQGIFLVLSLNYCTYYTDDAIQ